MYDCVNSYFFLPLSVADSATPLSTHMSQSCVLAHSGHPTIINLEYSVCVCVFFFSKGWGVQVRQGAYIIVFQTSTLFLLE